MLVRQGQALAGVLRAVLTEPSPQPWFSKSPVENPDEPSEDTGCQHAPEVAIRRCLSRNPLGTSKRAMDGSLLGRLIRQSPPKCHRRRWFRLMSSVPRGKVHVATDIAH